MVHHYPCVNHPRDHWGTALSRDAIEHRLAHYATKAAAHCPSLHGKTVTAHVLRHTTAMRLLHAGVDTSVIALWLGHVSVDTTQTYLQADLEPKEKALAQTRSPNAAQAATSPRQPPRLARSTLILPTSPARNPYPTRESSSPSA
jgi:integrase